MNREECFLCDKRSEGFGFCFEHSIDDMQRGTCLVGRRPCAMSPDQIIEGSGFDPVRGSCPVVGVEPDAEIEFCPERVSGVRSASTRRAEWALEQIDYREEAEPRLLRGSRHFEPVSSLESFHWK